MTLEGFGYKEDGTESDEPSEESSTSRRPSPNMRRAFGRTVRPHISFSRRDVSLPPEEARPSVFETIGSKPGEPDLEFKPSEHKDDAVGKGRLAIPPSAWLPNRPLVMGDEGQEGIIDLANNTQDDDEDEETRENDQRSDARDDKTAEADAGRDENASAEPLVSHESSADDDRILEQAIRGVPDKPQPAADMVDLANPADPNRPAPIAASPALAPTPSTPQNPNPNMLPAAQYNYAQQLAAPVAPVSPAAAAWHPAWRQETPNVGNYYPATQRPITQDQLNQEKHFAEVRGQRRGVVAGLLTGYLIKQYLSNRKLKRFQKDTEKQFDLRDRHITELTTEQQVLRQKLASAEERFKQAKGNQLQQPFEQPQPAVFNQQHQAVPLPAREQLAPQANAPAAGDFSKDIAHSTALELVAQAYDQRPAQLREAAEAGRVANSQGFEVPGAAVVTPQGAKGKEYYQERLAEQGRLHAGVGSGSGAAGGGAYQGAGGATPMLNLPSGQADFAHKLPSGYPPVDPQHRLTSSTQRPATALATSPLLWVGLAILLIAFFAAAFL